MKVSLLDVKTFDPSQLPKDKCHFIVSLPETHCSNPSKSLHDLDQSLNRLHILSDLIKQGFDFKQSSGQALIPQLEESLIRLRSNTDVFRALLEQLLLSTQR